MNNGVEIPIGKVTQYPQSQANYGIMDSPEYIVYTNNQVRMRYLIQIERESF
jgi:hypothetical protein